MNLPNKITITRIFLAFIVLILLIFPFYQIDFHFPTYLVFGKVTLDLKYIIAGGLFIIASITDFLDGYIARSRNLVTDFGKVADAIADKILVNGVLIALAVNGTISVIIPVVIVTRDIIVDSIKMVAGSKNKAVSASNLGKVKTIFMMVGISLTFFSNLPFELINIKISDILLLLATILSVISACQYFANNKEYIMPKN